MNDPNPATDNAHEATIGVDADGRPVWKKIQPYHVGPERLADLINQIVGDRWHPDRSLLQEADIAAAGADYADRWNRFRMGERGGGKSSMLAAIANWANRAGVPLWTVDSKSHMPMVDWSTLRPRTLLERIDEVIADAEAILDEVRRA